MLVVYIAGPFRAPSAWHREQHIRRAEGAALAVWALGVAVICPHTNTRFFDGALPDEVWLQGDLELLRRCDAVLTVGDWMASSGAKAEVLIASAEDIPVFHTQETLAVWVKTKQAQEG